MRKTYLSQQIKAIHFIGIGGVGMSGIAEILSTLGYNVQGSDMNLSPITVRLAKLGVRIFEGHDPDHLGGADVVVVSTAIRHDNPELVSARAKGLTIVKRAEMLAELMRLKSTIAISGTHGKTTTTTFISEMLVSAGHDPTVVNGGILHQLNSNARLGQGEWMVLEADESDGTFARLQPTIAVITNIDPEHLDFWGTFEALKQGFWDFVENTPFYGVSVCCTDHPEVQALVGKIENRRIVSYGFNAQADIRAHNVRFRDGKSFFDIHFAGAFEKRGSIEGCVLPMPGAHNVSNVLAAVGVGASLGLSGKEMREAIAKFRGVKRRFSLVGDVGGIKIIDDYAHHPVEITATLSCARQVARGRVIALHQPHRFSRLSHLFKEFCTCFNEADFVGITDIFSAGEAPIEGVSRDALVRGLGAYGHRNVCALGGLDAAKAYIWEHAKPDDVVLCLGAGSIGAWGAEIVRFLQEKGAHKGAP